MVFSPDAQRVIVEETHKRGLVAETHATTPEALRTAVLAGIDVVQHPEALGLREIPDALVKMIVDRGIVCSMLPNKYTGRIRERFLARQAEALKEEAARKATAARRVPRTGAEIRRYQADTGIKQAETILIPDLDMRWRNAKKLIAAGCTVSVGADDLLFGRPGVAWEFLRENHAVPEHLEPGSGTVAGMEGLVELGMTPSEVIVAATKNGAMASKALADYGTVEPGKIADLLLLDADPLADIRNIRKLRLIVKSGRPIDPGSLPHSWVSGPW
jgi:imidazolonepropionase-like amidohydrolase